MKLRNILCMFLAISVTALSLTACGAADMSGIEDAGQDTEKNIAGYIVTCRTEDGEPVKGVTLQLCSDTSCKQEVTGAMGAVLFTAEPGEYDISIAEIPEGYAVKGDAELKTSKDANNYEFVLSKAEDTAAADFETAPESKAAADAEIAGSTESAAAEAEKNEAYAPSDSDKKRHYADMKYLDGIDLTGVKTIMVNYWEPWCPYCVEEMPDLEKLYQKYKDEGLLIVGMYEYTEDAEDTIKETGVTYPIVHLPQKSMYTAQGYPETVFVDTDGNLMEPADLFEGWADEYGYGGAAGYEYWEPVVQEMMKK